MSRFRLHGENQTINTQKRSKYGPEGWDDFYEGKISTLPETNIAPENRPLQKEIGIGNHHF